MLPGSSGLRILSAYGVCFCSFTKSCSILCSSMDCSTPGFPVLHYLPDLFRLMSIESMMPSNHLILCRLLFLLPSVFSSIRVFSSEPALHSRWPKHWSFSVSPFNEYSGFISFRIDWFDLLAEQGTLKSLFSARKTIALTRWTFVGKVISLLFNMLSRLIRAFLPRSKHLLISWLQ